MKRVVLPLFALRCGLVLLAPCRGGRLGDANVGNDDRRSRWDLPMVAGRRAAYASAGFHPTGGKLGSRGRGYRPSMSSATTIRTSPFLRPSTIQAVCPLVQPTASAGIGAPPTEET